MYCQNIALFLGLRVVALLYKITLTKLIGKIIYKKLKIENFIFRLYGQ